MFWVGDESSARLYTGAVEAFTRLMGAQLAIGVKLRVVKPIYVKA
jgi:hypothetical protein